MIGRTGADAKGKLVALDPGYTRHMLRQHGGESEILRGQKPLTKTDIVKAAKHLNRSRDIVPAASAGRGGHPRFVANTQTARTQITIVGEVRKRRVVIVSMWKRGK